MQPIREVTRDFAVCGTCHELRGAFVGHVQQCRCERPAPGDQERPETWEGFDFNTLAELCNACGCDVLRSGSRSSVWFCSVCRARVLELRAQTGRVVVPIGRHSIMNGSALPMTPEPTDLDVEAFADRLLLVGSRINRLAEWAHAVVGSNLAAIGRGKVASLPLAEYLDAVRDFDRGKRSTRRWRGWRISRPDSAPAPRTRSTGRRRRRRPSKIFATIARELGDY